MEEQKKVTDDLVSLWRCCARKGDDGDWCRLLARVDGLVRFYLREKLWAIEGRAPTEIVEDLTQEVYCRLIDHGRGALRRCRARCEAQIFAYLKTIVSTVVLDRGRRLRAQKRGASLQPLGNRELSPCAVLSRRDELSPEERLLAAEARVLLRRQIRALSAPDRVGRDGWIFERAVLDGWTSREIARHVGLAASSIDSLLHRMRRRLGEAGLAVPQRQ